MTSLTESGWFPDLIYTGGEFRSNVAMFADSTGQITRFSSDPADLAKALRLAGRALLPGMVNAHSHAFQRVLRGRTEQRTSTDRDSFWTWRAAMYRAANGLSPDGIYRASRMAFLEMALSGITTVGEFHYVDASTETALHVIRAACEIGLRIALLRTAYVRSAWNKPAEPAQSRFLTPRVDDFLAGTEALPSTEYAWVGLAPHSLRAVPLDYLREVAAFARGRKLPLHMHVSEQPADVEACLAEYGKRPVELLSHNAILDSRFTAIHAIHVTREEISALGNAGASVCVCPTTERNLGDGTAPADRFLHEKVPISLGSDSNIEVNLLQDARSLEYHLRMVSLQRALTEPRQLFACATQSGAVSLGAPVGSLEVGRAADFFTLALDDPSLAGAASETLLTQIVFSAEKTALRDVAVSGRFIVRDGHHPLAEEIVHDFAAVQRQLWS